VKEVEINLLLDGEVLASPVVAHNGIVLLETGTVLTETYIDRLREKGIRRVRIKTRGDHAESQPLEMLEQNSRKQYIASVHQFSEVERKVKQFVMQIADSELLNGIAADPYMENRFRRMFRYFLYDVASNGSVMKCLVRLFQTDRYLFDHAIHVAIYSGVIGVARDYSSSELFDLCVGALLCDIGMTYMPDTLLHNSGPLTLPERAMVANHPKIGYDEVAGMPGIPARSAKCVLQHHERFNGTGYPYKLSGKDLDEHAQIVSIADTYHAIISPRSHRRQFSANEATEFLFASGDSFFSLELIKLFLKYVCVYRISSIVTLSSGQVGIVSGVNSSFVHRPTVKIIREADGREVRFPYEIDLIHSTDLVILTG